MNSSSGKPQVGVVIPTWNGREMLDLCLRALRGQTYREHRVYVVDNGSTDGTREMLARDFPEVRVTAFPTNRGFAAAVNAGIRAGSEPLVALVNNDVILESLWLEKIVARALAHGDEDSWTTVLLWAHRPDLVESAGLSLFRDGTPAILYRSRPVDELPAEPLEVLGAYGGAAVYRRRVLDVVGLFDERFVSYGEDMDLALRARLAGFRCFLLPDARGTHRHMATSSRVPLRSACQQYRNIVLYLLKNLPAGFLCRRLPRFAFTGLRPLVCTPWEGLGWALQGAKFSVLWNLPHALCARRRIRAVKRVPDAAIQALFVAGRSRPTAEERP
jgi:GT2 family glycosyltransferase